MNCFTEKNYVKNSVYLTFPLLANGIDTCRHPVKHLHGTVLAAVLTLLIGVWPPAPCHNHEGAMMRGRQ